MGIDIGSKMIVGMSYEDWENFVEENYKSLLELPHLTFGEFFVEDYLAKDYQFNIEDVDTLDFLREGLDLDEISPWYDADTAYRFYGIKVYSADGIIGVRHFADLEADCAEAEEKLENLLGIDLFIKLHRAGNLEVLFGADVS